MDTDNFVQHRLGLFRDVPEGEFEAAEEFCATVPLEAPRILPSHQIECINTIGARAWGIAPAEQGSRFAGVVTHGPRDGKEKDIKAPGTVRVQTDARCGDYCLMSDLPIMAGNYTIPGKVGVYYEILIHRMDPNGFISIGTNILLVIRMPLMIFVGTACRPYPLWRHPGWNRGSAALHLDDMRKFFEDPDGGRDYTTALKTIRSGDTIGCGYEFQTGALFFTYNGLRLPNAFTGIYLPRRNFDVYAAIGVEGACDFEVNFGGEFVKWQEGNEWQWNVDGIFGQLGPVEVLDEELPAYTRMA